MITLKISDKTEKNIDDHTADIKYDKLISTFS